jgi:hypothetical protein
MIARVKALEAAHKQQSIDLKTICSNVKRMADSMEKLAEIIPLITLAHSFRTVFVWAAPIMAGVGMVWGGYLALSKVLGYG